MLLVYGALVMGGIETFFVRLIKSRYEMGLKTKILLTQPEIFSHPELLSEARKYGDVVFIQQLFAVPSVVLKVIPKAFFPLLPVKRDVVGQVFKDISQIHVSDGFSAIVAFSFMQRLEKQLPITVGFYHSKEFLWGANKNLPYFEKVNRTFVFNCLAQSNLIIFNESLVALYQQHGRDLSNANCFPIGVVDVSSSDISLAFCVKSVSPLKIVSVGRLVDFKQYNKWMIELVAELKNSAMSLEYHIYGNGPLEASLRDLTKRLGVVDAVHFHGLLNYADFDATVAQYDIFVGSGTAIVQAAALGVPSIIGIENVAEPYSYGYIADIAGFSYNENGLYEKMPVAGLLHRYFAMSDTDKTMLKHKHIEKAKTFSMATCIANFACVEANAKPANITRLPKFRYCASLLLNVVLAKLIKTHSLRFKYVD